MSQRYAWLGAARKRAVRDIALSCFDAWLRDWCLQPGASEATVEEAPLISLPSEEYATWVVEAEDGHLLAALPRERIDAFGGRLASAEAGPSDGMAAELARFAMQDLLVRLAARVRCVHASPIPWEDAWPGTILDPVWGGLGLRISFDGFNLVLGMDRAAIDMMCPERAKVTDGLLDRSKSLAQVPVTLSAVLDFGSVNASDLADLRVGEVLVSEHAIGDPVVLRAGDRHVFNASLARAGSQFAIVAAALPTGENR
jgi:hypothetical protein